MPSLLSRLSAHETFEGKGSVTSGDNKRWLINEIKMVFSSRSRNSYIESLSEVGGTILNYGFDDSFSHIHEPGSRKIIIEERIRMVLQRFEPRLTDVVVYTKACPFSVILFEIEGLHDKIPVRFELAWDDSILRLDFNE